MSQPAEEEQKVQQTPTKASCHCGAIVITASRKPYNLVNECQCSICRRYGAVWAYYQKGEVEIQKNGVIAANADEGEGTKRYVWGNEMIAFHFCEHCGCCIYWWPIEGRFPAGADKVGVNTRMMEPEAVYGLNRRVMYTYEARGDC